MDETRRANMSGRVASWVNIVASSSRTLPPAVLVQQTQTNKWHRAGVQPHAKETQISLEDNAPIQKIFFVFCVGFSGVFFSDLARCAQELAFHGQSQKLLLLIVGCGGRRAHG